MTWSILSELTEYRFSAFFVSNLVSANGEEMERINKVGFHRADQFELLNGRAVLLSLRMCEGKIVTSVRIVGLLAHTLLILRDQIEDGQV